MNVHPSDLWWQPRRHPVVHLVARAGEVGGEVQVSPVRDPVYHPESESPRQETRQLFLQYNTQVSHPESEGPRQETRQLFLQYTM